MAKESGLGDNFYIGTYNLSGDVGSLGSISGGPALLEVTAIDKSAMERLGGLRTGHIEFSAFFNPSSNQSHIGLRDLVIVDRRAMYCRGTTIGAPSANCVGKQLNYDWNRGTDGSLTLAVRVESNAYGLEWGELLTPGLRTDTGATNGASLDTTASLSFGGQAYLQVTSFTGTDVTIKIQDSADDSSWADVASLAFNGVSSASTNRVATSNTATIRRYVRVATTTSGGFTSVTFAVSMVKNLIAGQAF